MSNNLRRENAKKRALDYLREIGYKFLAWEDRKEGERSRLDIRVECTHGHIISLQDRILYSALKRKDANPCLYCKGAKIHPTEITTEADRRGYQWVGGEYTNVLSKLTFRCPKGHSWTTNWKSFRTNNCAHCSGHVPIVKEKILEEVQREGYIWVSGEYSGSKDKNLNFRCPKGHLYETRWSSWVGGNRCPVCFGVFKYTRDQAKELAQSWGSSEEHNFICPKGHQHRQIWKNLQNYKACPMCNSRGSQGETEILDWLHSLGHTSIIQNDRTVLGEKRELDLYLPDLKFAIEFCGTYWHSEKFIDRDYHLRKLQSCKEKGIRLFTVFEDEWKLRRNQIQGFLLSQLGHNLKISARKCSISPLFGNLWREFLEENHIQGSANCSHAFGLYLEGKLVMGLSLSRHHRQNSDEWVLNRLCTLRGTTVVGGLQRLLKRALRETGINTVITFADRRYSEGNGYLKSGFAIEKILKPDYCYSKSGFRFPKQSLRKTPIERATGRTEHQLRLEQGYLRIYDCGKIRFRYTP